MDSTLPCLSTKASVSFSRAFVVFPIAETITTIFWSGNFLSTEATFLTDSASFTEAPPNLKTLRDILFFIKPLLKQIYVHFFKAPKFIVFVVCVSDCSGNPLRSKDWSGKRDPKGNAHIFTNFQID